MNWKRHHHHQRFKQRPGSLPAPRRGPQAPCAASAVRAAGPGLCPRSGAGRGRGGGVKRGGALRAGGRSSGRLRAGLSGGGSLCGGAGGGGLREKLLSGPCPAPADPQRPRGAQGTGTLPAPGDGCLAASPARPGPPEPPAPPGAAGRARAPPDGAPCGPGPSFSSSSPRGRRSPGPRGPA